MYSKIHRGRLRIVFDEPDLDEVFRLREKIFSLVGSAREVLIGTGKAAKSNPRELSCAFSAKNFQALARLHLKMPKEPHSLKLVKQLRERLDDFEAESARGTRVKAGFQPYKIEDYKFKVKPFSHQVLGFQFLHSMKTVALFGDCGTGKFHSVSTPVLTPEGWRQIGTLKVGDLVIARDGKPYPVTGVYPQGVKPLFRVTFNDGASVLAGAEHLWLVRSFNDDQRQRPWRTMTTAEIMAAGLFYGKAQQSRRWRIPLVEPIRFAEQYLPLHPYILGVLLGDGSITTGTPGWTKNDPEIATTIESLLPSGCTVHKLVAADRAQPWSIVSPLSQVNPITQALRNLGLLGCRSWEKSVPDCYLFASPQQRLQLLQGLLDTDGGTSGNASTVEYSSASKQLADAVVFLVQSLGGRAKRGYKPRPTYSYKDETRIGRPSHRVHLSLPPDVQPFRLERKLHPHSHRIVRTITSIEPEGSGETVCISVDSPDKTYVVNDFIVTHNTFIVVTWADSMLKAGHDMAFIVICPINLINHVWGDDSKKFSDLTFTSLREPSQPRTLGEDWDDKLDGELPFKERAALRASRKESDEWRSRARRRARTRHNKMLDARFGNDTDLYVLNPENLRIDNKEKRVLALIKRLLAEGKEICLVVDESSMLKSRISRTYKALKRARANCSNCIIMTGTPSPNGILDLWAQFDLLDRGMTLGPNFVDFRHDTCHEIELRGVTWKDKQNKSHTATKWQPKSDAAFRVHKTIEPRMIRFRTDDCLDLPPYRFIIRNVEMSDLQTEVYDDMENWLVTEL